MNRIHDILDQIKDTQGALVVYEGVTTSPEDDFAVQLSRRSVTKRLANLEEQLAETAAQSEQAILDYRIFVGETDQADEIKMGSIGKAMANFQTFFSTVYDSLANGPKIRANFDAPVEERSSFKFLDSYQGSAGLLFVIDNPGETVATRVEEAMDSILGIVQNGESGAISRFAKRFGAAAVRKFYAWANDHTLSALGADLKWQARKLPRVAVQISLAKFLQLRDTIAETNDERSEMVDSFGLLVGADTDTRTFHMRMPSGAHIKGHISEQVPKEKYRQIDTSYRVKFQKKVTVHYAADKETTEYTILDLVQPAPLSL